MTGRRFHKCGLGLVTNGAATDIRTSAPACRLWTRVGAHLCDTCVYACSWNGQGPGCSHSSVNQALGREPPPCRGKYFVRQRPVEIRAGQVLVDGKPLVDATEQGEP